MSSNHCSSVLPSTSIWSSGIVTLDSKCPYRIQASYLNVAEKDNPANLSLRGLGVNDAVKAALELVYPEVFSCADILQEVALAAQRYVDQPNPRSQWRLKYGRYDGRVSLATEAAEFILSPDMNYPQLVANFAAKGLNKFDLVVLSGSHTFGVAHCIAFTQRLYNYSGNGSGTDPDLAPNYAEILKDKGPQDKPLNIVNLDVTTPSTFDNKYFSNIFAGKAFLASDNALRSDPDGVNFNAASNSQFVMINFAHSMRKMTEIEVKVPPAREIRSNCALQN